MNRWMHAPCWLRNIACDFQKMQIPGRPTDRPMPDKMIPVWLYASQVHKNPQVVSDESEKSISLLTLVNNFHHKKTSICRLNISRVETIADLFHSCPPHRTSSPYIHIYRARLANFWLHAFSLWCTIVCVTVTVHLFYLIVSSLLTIVPFAVRGWYLSYVLYPWGERIHYTTNLYLQVTDIAGIHSCTRYRYAYSSSASGFLGVSVGPSLYTVVCATVIVHQLFWMYLYYVLLHILVELVVQFPASGSTQKCYYAFFLVCCGCDTSYIVSVHIQCQASIYTLSLCRGHSWRVQLAKQETLTPPGHLVSPLVCRGPWISTVVLYCWCHSDSASVLLYFTF